MCVVRENFQTHLRERDITLNSPWPWHNGLYVLEKNHEKVSQDLVCFSMFPPAMTCVALPNPPCHDRLSLLRL